MRLEWRLEWVLNFIIEVYDILKDAISETENVSNEKWLKRQKQPVQEEEGQIKPILKCRGWKKSLDLLQSLFSLTVYTLKLST